MLRHDRRTRAFTGPLALSVAAALTVLSACSSAPQGSASLATESGTPTESATPTPSSTESGPSPIAVPNIDAEAPLEIVWEAGAPTVTAPGTWSVAVDPQGRIWATANHENQIWIVDREGAFLEVWGTPGDGDGEFNFETQSGSFGAIGFAPDGGFYVADTGNQRVQRFDAERTFVSAWGSFGTGDGQFVSPIVLAVSGNGSVYVLDDARGDVQRFDADGTFVEVVAAGSVWPASLAGDADGNVYYIEGEDPILTRRSSEGEVTLRVDLAAISGPFWTGIAVDGDGSIFVTSESSGGSFPEPSHLLMLDAEGAAMHLWPNGGHGIAVDPAGDRVYAAFGSWDHVTAYILPGG